MNTDDFLNSLSNQLKDLESQGLYKKERIMTSAQSAHIRTENRNVVNMCANNYLGLSNEPRLIEAATNALKEYGFGLSSVRFICGTQDIHRELERRLSEFLGTEDTILYSSCFDANGGLFETLLSEDDAIISDALNHASIIDGIRLAKAKRFRYANNDMNDLEAQLIAAKDSRFKLIATDGVFSMDGIIADLASICKIAKTHDSMVMVDDSHAVGFVGPKGRGTHEHAGVMDQIDIITGTLGKALGGASGGYTSGRKEIISWLRQRSRPYLFSNSLAPVIAKTSLAVLDIIQNSTALRDKVWENTGYFRREIKNLGFEIIPGEHPIVPIMIGDAALATKFADEMLKEGIYVIGFSFPVVPKGKARIRTQISAGHSRSDLDQALTAFAKVGRQLKIIS